MNNVCLSKRIVLPLIAHSSHYVLPPKPECMSSSSYPAFPSYLKYRVHLPHTSHPLDHCLQQVTDPSYNCPSPKVTFSSGSIVFITTTSEIMRNLIFEEPEEGIPGYASSSLRYAWQSIRAPVIIPLLKLAVILCSIMSVMLFLERVGMAAVILMVKVLRKKKYTKYKLDAMKQNLERNKKYPMVLIQIPMYNEKEVALLFN